MCVGLVRERRERQEREKEGLRRGGKSPQCNAPSWHVPSNYVVTSDVKMPPGSTWKRTWGPPGGIHPEWLTQSTGGQKTPRISWTPRPMRCPHVSIIRIGELGGWLLPRPLPQPAPRAATQNKKKTGRRRRAPENHSPSASCAMAASVATLAFSSPSAPGEVRNLPARPLLPASHRAILPSLRRSYCESSPFYFSPR